MSFSPKERAAIERVAFEQWQREHPRYVLVPVKTLRVETKSFEELTANPFDRLFMRLLEAMS